MRRNLNNLKPVVLFLCIVLLLSSCGAIREARERDKMHKGKHNEEHHASSNKGLIPKYEEIIGISISNKSAALYTFIDNWMGVPYCYGGMSHKCTDCSGFVLNLYKEVYHIELPHTAEKMYDMADRVKQKNLKEGQLIFFDTDKGKSISHVGVYLGNHKFVHASSSKGVRIDDLEEEYWKNAYKASGKIQ